MKALSLWEPWATFIARGWKTIETRGWRTPYRGPIAIHAAKTKQCIRYDNDVDDILHEARLPLDSLKGHVWPLGCIVATAKLVECRPTEKLEESASIQDIAMGNFSDGRFGWVLAEVKALPVPIPLVGQQGLWELCPEALEVLAGRVPVPTTAIGRSSAKARFEKSDRSTPLFPEARS